MATFSTFYFYGVATFVTAFITIVANIMTIVAFLMERNLRARASNLLVFALSVTDLLFGAYVFIYYGVTITFGLGHPFKEIGCRLSLLFEYSYIVGNLLLIAISIDRVLLISLDYSKYMKMQSESRMKVTICICFLIGLAGALVEIGIWDFAKRKSAAAASIPFDEYCLFAPRRLKEFGMYVSIVFFCMPVLIIGMLSTAFFLLLLRRIRKKASIGISATSGSNSSAVPQSQAVDPDNQGNNQGSTNHGNIQQKDDGSAKSRYRKPAITLAALVTSMMLSMFPYCVYLIVAAVRPELNNASVVYIMVLIYQFNPMLDPIFYAATHKQIRQFYQAKARKMIGCFKV